MFERLRMSINHYTIKTGEVNDQKITYRAFENLLYCEYPVDPIQKMNLYVPEIYFHGESIGRYSKTTAPIFLPNTVGGFIPGVVDEPGIDKRTQKKNAIFQALEHGYVVASVGVRGRTSGKVATEFFEGSKEGMLGEATGKMVGRAPAFIIDLKAAIRYLRFNKAVIPGDTEKIITSGTSAGGALSALAGASGNVIDYEPYLKKMGAAPEKDDIFAANCYCPIHNLENADAAYEWQFAGQQQFYRTKYLRSASGTIKVPHTGTMTEKQQTLSVSLKKMFSGYLNQLSLQTENGETLFLDADGEGNFKAYVKECLIQSAQKEWTTRENEISRPNLLVPGSEIEQQDYITVKENQVVDLDWSKFIAKITRMKATPAFDALDLTSPENEEFGDEQVDARHFTAFAMAHSEKKDAEMADEKIIRLLNPTLLIDEKTADVAPHWRIRHGAFDRDTSLAIPIIFSTMLKNRGFDVDFSLPWGIPHSGDYDLTELFEWIDLLYQDQLPVENLG